MKIWVKFVHCCFKLKKAPPPLRNPGYAPGSIVCQLWLRCLRLKCFWIFGNVGPHTLLYHRIRALKSEKCNKTLISGQVHSFWYIFLFFLIKSSTIGCTKGCVAKRQCLLHRPGFQHLIAAAPMTAVVSFCCSIHSLSIWYHCPNPNSNRKVLEKRKGLCSKFAF